MKICLEGKPMDLAVDEELQLRRIVRSENKEELLRELSVEIEAKEKTMLERISKDYLDIINKCTDLERMKLVLPRIIAANNELSMAIRDATMQHIGVMREIEENGQMRMRLDLVLDELREVFGFMGRAASCCEAGDTREDPLLYHSLARDVVTMRSKLGLFQKYVFFSSMSRVLEQTKRRVTDMMTRDVDLWIRGVCNELSGIGAEVRKMDVGEKSLVFDALGMLRCRMVSRVFLGVLYGSRRIGADGAVVARINAKRKEFVEGVLRTSEESMLGVVIGFVLWGHYLIDLDAGFRTHHKAMFAALSRNEMVSRGSERLREDLVLLRRLLVHLRMDVEDLDGIVSAVAVHYFESQGPQDRGDSDLDGFRQDMVAFVDESYAFVSNVSQFSNELDELLAKKVDAHLCGLIERSSSDVNLFADAQHAAREVVDYMVEKNGFYRNIELRCVAEMERMNRVFAEDAVRYNRAKIDALVDGLGRNNDFGVDLLRLFSKARDSGLPSEFNEEIKRSLVEHIRDCLMEAMRSSGQETKTVAGHICSFYGYLRKHEPSLASVFGPAVELCKNRGE